MSKTEDRDFYTRLSMVRAVTEYLDVTGFEERYAKATSDIERFDIAVDLDGRLRVAIGQFDPVASRVESDASIPFQGWWPYQYEDQIEKITRK
jgi:hypothetical protein